MVQLGRERELVLLLQLGSKGLLLQWVLGMRG
jgi:hypothetical protein